MLGGHKTVCHCDGFHALTWGMGRRQWQGHGATKMRGGQHGERWPLGGCRVLLEQGIGGCPFNGWCKGFAELLDEPLKALCPSYILACKGIIHAEGYDVCYY